jgi:hypothetical protein
MHQQASGEAYQPRRFAFNSANITNLRLPRNFSNALGSIPVMQLARAACIQLETAIIRQFQAHPIPGFCAIPRIKQLRG